MRGSPSKLKRDAARARAHAVHKAASAVVENVAAVHTSRAQRSPSSLCLSRKRRAAWLRWRQDRHAVLPEDKVWLLQRLAVAAKAKTGSFGKFVESFEPSYSTCRRRDFYPLSRVSGVEFKPAEMSSLRWSPLRDFVNVVINSLNWLCGVKRSGAVQRRQTVSQCTIIKRIVSRAFDSLCGLQEVMEGSWERFLPDFVTPFDKTSGAHFQDLVAARVDNLQVAAACDPTPCLPTQVQKLVTDGNMLFPNAPGGLEHFEKFSAGSRKEYAKLIVAQLRCGKLGLSKYCKDGGTSLAVGKPGGVRLREVWHGRRVSQAALQPPKPRHLASPTALTLLEAAEDKPVRVSKRDASCWFDQLKLPLALREYMAKPTVSTEELAAAGMPAAEQAIHLQAGESWKEGHYYPLHHVWPMGFSWSSYIAQEEMLDICANAGLPESSLLACDCETPDSFALVAAVATDDVMLFSNASPGTTTAAAQALDNEFEARGVVRNTAKDVDDALSATVVGVNLVDGKYLDVPPARHLAMLVSFLFLHKRAVATPKQVQQLLGTLQWYDLLLRPKLSIYNTVYAFVRSEREDVEVAIPCDVLAELACSLCHALFWRCDLTRPFLSLLGATDASTEHGFGASVVLANEACVRRIARWAERQGAFIVMDGGADVAQRLGPGHRLDFSLNEFTDVFSVQSSFPAHINVLEGEVFVLFLRWLLRSRQHHSKRVVVLLDSSVWVGAAAKGRSSSQLNRLLRKVAALVMVGNLQLHLILVPSSENPSDAPSRGVKRRGHSLAAQRR